MKILILITFLITIIRAQTRRDDVIILTLEHQKSIKLDSVLYNYLDNKLTLARETDDTLSYIHTFAPYAVNQLLLNTTAIWADAWENGDLVTGNTAIDSLSDLYGLEFAKGDKYNNFLLQFNQPMRIDDLALVYEGIDSIVYAEPNFVMGDGDRIIYFHKNDKDHFVFSKGWGDCPAGCISRYYWYVEVEDTSARKLAENPRENTHSRFYTWNFPDIFSMTHFNSAEAIIDSIQFSDRWWIQRHSIEGSWRFFIYGSPVYYADENAGWPSLQKSIKSKAHKLLDVLEQAKLNSDQDVAASAEYAIQQIRSVTSLNESIYNPDKTALIGNYPNPFNPSTTISYNLAANYNSPIHVSLKIYDVLGREVKTLVYGKQTAGEYNIAFDAEKLSGGVYYYRLQAGDFIQTRKMLLLR